MKTFFVIWFGQTVSLFGTGLTTFALGVWVYQATGSVTKFALIAFFGVLPGLLMAPLAGALVDRWDRRWLLVGTNVAGVAVSLGLLLLLWSDQLVMWHIYTLMALASVANAFQLPAWTATTTLIVPRKHLGRASGLTQMAFALQIASPVAGAALLIAIGLEGVLLIDLVSFLFAVTTLLLVRFTSPRTSGEVGVASIARDVQLGYRFILDRKGLLALLTLFAGTNFAVGMLQALLTPLILSFASATALGTVMSIAGAGALLGSIAMSVWGGPQRRIAGVFVPSVLQGFILLLGGLQPNLLLIGAAAFVFLFTNPIIISSSQVIWQSKVPVEMQGRVFSVRRMVAQGAVPLAYFVAGPLADRVFEPWLAPGGLLADSVGAVIGVGEGRGVALLLMVLGVLMLTLVAIGWSYPRLRRLEDELPDTLPEEAPATQRPAVGEAAEAGSP